MQSRFYTVVLSVLVLLGISATESVAQSTAINNTGAPADPSAGLDINFNDKGFLIPRLTIAQRNAIGNPALSLLIFNITDTCLQIWMGSYWYDIACYTTAPVAPPSCPGTPTITDVDGNVYNTVQIGAQCWMKENLKTTRYKNSTNIVNATANAVWAANTTGAYCCYNNDCPSYNADYGKLYNWYAVNNTNGLCPSGWHVPTHDEWTTLELAVCSSGTCATDFPYDVTTTSWRGSDEAYKLKETGTVHWIAPNTGATNNSGFTAVPAGYRTLSGPFAAPSPPETYTDWWWTSSVSATYAWFRAVDFSGKVNRNWTGKAIGMSVRCVMN